MNKRTTLADLPADEAAAMLHEAEVNGLTAEPAKRQPKAKPEPVKPMTRSELLAALAERKYDGPVSFTATTLRDVLTWLEAGANPGDESIPNGVRFAVHPDLRPSKAKANTVGKIEAAYDRGRASVLAEVAALSTLKAIRDYVAANQTEDDK